MSQVSSRPVRVKVTPTYWFPVYYVSVGHAFDLHVAKNVATPVQGWAELELSAHALASIWSWSHKYYDIRFSINPKLGCYAPYETWTYYDLYITRIPYTPYIKKRGATLVSHPV